MDPHIQRAVEQAAARTGQQEHDTDANEVLLRLYLAKRIDGQMQFYEARATEFNANIGFMVSVGAGIMAISAIVSAIGATNNSAELALVTAILPAIAAFVAALRQLYQWEKQSSLYRDASLGLQETRLLVPDWDQFDPKTAPAIVPSLVRATEDVFMAEINQWGQIALGLDDQEQDTLNQALLDLAATDPSIDVTPTAAASAGTSISTSTSESESTPERGSGDYEDGGRG
jgi:hypothetical protein